LVCGALMDDLRLQQWAESTYQEIWVKPWYLKEYVSLCDRDVKVMLTCVGTVQGIGCRGDVAQQTLVFGHTVTGTFVLILWSAMWAYSLWALFFSAVYVIDNFFLVMLYVLYWVCGFVWMCGFVLVCSFVWMCGFVWVCGFVWMCSFVWMCGCLNVWFC
jgi:hypothetical protein